MKLRFLVLILAAGCTEENPSLVIERQPAALAAATADGWVPGSVVLAGQPGTFTFPQPVSIRFSIVGEATEGTEPMQLAISAGQVEMFEAGPLSITTGATCEGVYCTAELGVSALGSGMVAVEAMGPQGPERECFYYAVVEDAAVDTMMLRAELETQQRDCKFELE